MSKPELVDTRPKSPFPLFIALLSTASGYTETVSNASVVDFGPEGKPLMHRTQSLDYGVVLEGTIEMELDDGSVTRLKRGDVAVQRGTNHAWRNPSKTEWTRMLFVLQDCQPLVVGGERYREDLGEGGKEIPRSGNDE